MSLGKVQNHSAVPPLHLQRGGSGSRQHRIICVVIFGLLLMLSNRRVLVAGSRNMFLQWWRSFCRAWMFCCVWIGTSYLRVLNSLQFGWISSFRWFGLIPDGAAAGHYALCIKWRGGELSLLNVWFKASRHKWCRNSILSSSYSKSEWESLLTCVTDAHRLPRRRRRRRSGLDVNLFELVCLNYKGVTQPAGGAGLTSVHSSHLCMCTSMLLYLGVKTLWHQREDVFTAIARQLSPWRWRIAGTDRSSIVRGVALRKPLSGKIRTVSDERCSSRCVCVYRWDRGKKVSLCRLSVKSQRYCVFVCVCGCAQRWEAGGGKRRSGPCSGESFKGFLLCSGLPVQRRLSLR